MSEKYSSHFDSYEGPSPWENKNNKNNPFDTNSTSINQNTSAFDDKKESNIHDTSMFDSYNNKSNLGVNKKNPFEFSNKYTNNKKFIYFNPEGLPSVRKNKKIGDIIVKKYLKNKYKTINKSNELKEELKNDLQTVNINKSFKKSNNQLLDEAIRDLKTRESILQKDKEHNLSIKVLEEKGKTKEEIFKIINEQNKPKFIKYEKIFVNSLPVEKVGNMTYCSRTARKNLYRLGVDKKLVPVGESAIASMKMYGDKKNYANSLNELPNSANVLDLFIDTTSEYEHRAAAYVSGGNWFVLDPYTKLESNKKNSTLPIPFDEYVSSKKLIGVYPYIINKSV